MYQPKISEENIRRLYRLKLRKKKPMTHLLDEIIGEYFTIHQEDIDTEEKIKS
jgi:hypothetical protein